MIVVLTLAVDARATTAAERTLTFTTPRVVAGDPSQLGDLHLLDPTLPLKSRRTLPPGLMPPGPLAANPGFEEQGLWIEAFWAVGIGTVEGHFIRGHFHPRDLATGFEAQHYGGPRELHGLFIKARDGRPFSLRRLKYRVTRNKEIPGQDRSIDGYSLYNVNVLIAESFSPTRSVGSQFMLFPVGLGTAVDPDGPFSTLTVVIFENVRQVFVASTASVDFDDIVVELEGPNVEESSPPPPLDTPDGGAVHTTPSREPDQ
jgi:hypothetical protein